MAQSAIQSPTDVVDFLVGQHRQIKGLFDQTWPTCWRGRSRQCSTAPEMPSSATVRPAIARRAIHPRTDAKTLGAERGSRASASRCRGIGNDQRTITLLVPAAAANRLLTSPQFTTFQNPLT